MNEYVALCVICTTPREPEPGTLACRHHIDRLAAMLRDVLDESALLDARPSMQIQSGRGSSLASHRAPAIIDAIVARDPRRGTGRIGYDDADPWGVDDTASVLDTLHSWARIVREERQITPPAAVTIASETDLWTRNLLWIAAQPWIDEAFKELRLLLGQLHNVNKTRPERPAGRCYLPAAGDEPCGGSIWRTERQHWPWVALADRCTRVDMQVADGTAYCEKCGQQWDERQLELRDEELRRQREEDARPRTEDGRPMLTAVELASVHKKPVSTIRTKLSRLKARAVDGHYDPAALQPVDNASICA